jgi:hypothetical protein
MQEMYSDAPYPGLILGSYLIWLVLSSALMLSLLVAIIGKSTEAHGDDSDKVWLFPVAGLVLRYEKLLSERQVDQMLLPATIMYGLHNLNLVSRFRLQQRKHRSGVAARYIAYLFDSSKTWMFAI